MGELIMPAPIAELTKKHRITSADVRMLRQNVYGDGIVARGEAETLFALDGTCTDKCHEWNAFFIEAISDYIVHQEQPYGYISEENGRWLIRAISRDGLVDSETELELLVQVLEKAKSAPEALAAYALEQVAKAVTEGRGPLAEGGARFPGVIEKPEVELVRRVLYAFGGGGNIAITRAEAEALFEINDRTVEEMNDPSWHDLFVKAIANFVMSSSGYVVPCRQEALRRDAFFERADADIGAFFSKMVSGGVRGILDAYSRSDDFEHDWEERNRRAEAETRRAAHIDAGEARWLADLIGKDRLLRNNERELLAFIRDASASIHPDLKPLIDKVA